LIFKNKHENGHLSGPVGFWQQAGGATQFARVAQVAKVDIAIRVISAE